ncbi:methyltransferase [Micromonospora sp. WMMD812]|uniref:methyltransferase n=1 Tax=Micromonospora sp. WMMD812 TaxID=3015152 RepID=UPI00248C9AD7|nr:methyltransferase [Micromonospora sp. WMMD812]WBB69278.1 methyltransferase [Micromonospora sp. WMMD812]
METTTAHGQRLRRMIQGHLLSRAVCVLADLRVPDLIGEGARDGPELARLTGTDPDALIRLLRALVTFEVLDERDDGFRLTPLGAGLRTDAPASALPSALLAHGQIGEAWQHLGNAVRTGTPSFPDLYGTDFFSYVDRNPAFREIFDRSQADGLALDGLADAVNLTGVRRIVDVGGGDGALLAALLTGHPHLHGTLLDLAAPARRAREQMRAAGLDGRCTVVTGDFFASVPAGGDLYLLRQILHDWDDARCVTLLRSCRRAMPPGARIVVSDLVLDTGPSAVPDESAALMDLYMLTVVGGRERTIAQFDDLFARAGLTIRRVTPLAGRTAAIEAVAARSVHEE